MILHTLTFRYFPICSNWTNFQNELPFLQDIFLKNGYPISLIHKHFKTFLDWLYLKRPQLLTAKKKTLHLLLTLPFLGELHLQTKTKLQNVLKRTLGFCKIQIVFKNERNLKETFSGLKIVYFMTLCLVSCMNFSVEDDMLPITVELTGT